MAFGASVILYLVTHFTFLADVDDFVGDERLADFFEFGIGEFLPK